MTTLYINLSSSRCGACNRNADPDEETHENEKMQGEGCGARYTHLSSDYAQFGRGGTLYDTIRAMRPDLEFVEPG